MGTFLAGTKYIINKVVDNNVRELYKLSAYSYENEISDLSTDFEIISSEKVYGRGRYIWDEPKTIKITLKNEEMLPNVYMQFLASKFGETLYSRDSIKKDYKNILSRIQSITFITDYLKVCTPPNATYSTKFLSINCGSINLSPDVFVSLMFCIT